MVTGDCSIEFLLLGLATGLAHSVFCLFLSLIFLEALLFRYGRVPFTSAFDSGNTNLGIALFLWFSLFLVYVYGTTAIESACSRVRRFSFAHSCCYMSAGDC